MLKLLVLQKARAALGRFGYKPESVYVEAFLENRYLELAKGNEEVEFDRAACLEYNEEIVKIATAGEGLAVYWRPEGLQRLG